jgi:hypothetical protein
MIRFLLFALVLLCAFLTPPPLHAQTGPCDGAPPTSFFVVPASGASFVFPYPTVDHDAGVVSYTLTFYKDSTAAPALSVQTVPKALAVVVGPVAGQTLQSCYALPLVPITDIPKGTALRATLLANSETTQLSSGNGPPTAPFGSALTDPALRPRQ